MSTMTERNRLNDPTVSFPETLEALPIEGSRFNDWVRHHNTAVHDFIRERVGATSSLRRPERAILSLMAGIDQYVSSSDLPDGVGTPAVGEMLNQFGTLLNFDLGRLDGGTLSQWAYATATRIGWDLDMNDWAK